MATDQSTGTAATAHAAWKTYVELIDEIWLDVQPLIGSITLSALFTSAIRHAANEHDFLTPMRVGNEGPDLVQLTELLAGEEPDEARAAAAALVKHLIAIFESVAGPIIVKHVMPKVIRAEP